MRVYNQDTEQHLRRINRRHWFRFGTALVAVAVISIGISIVLAAALGASSFQPRDGCGHTVTAGDTMTRIGQTNGVTLGQLAQVNPQIVDLDMIIVGEQVDVCAPGIAEDRPTLIDGKAIEWAQAVTATRPEWATDHDVRLLVALAGPESSWCTNTVNPGDAAPPVWGPSIGCLQVRTFLRASDLANEPWRDRQWLESQIGNQASASWYIYRAQGATAWGPARHAQGIGVKLPPSGDCTNAWRPALCREWWATADAALS